MAKTLEFNKCKSCGDISSYFNHCECSTIESNKEINIQGSYINHKFWLEKKGIKGIIVPVAIIIFILKFIIQISILGVSFWQYEAFYSSIIQFILCNLVFSFYYEYLQKYRNFNQWFRKWNFSEQEQSNYLNTERIFTIKVQKILKAELIVPFIVKIVPDIYGFYQYNNLFGSEFFKTNGIGGIEYLINSPGFLSIHWYLGFIFDFIFYCTITSFLFFIIFLGFFLEYQKKNLQNTRNPLEFEFVYLNKFFILKIKFIIYLICVGFLITIYGTIEIIVFNLIIYTLVFYGTSISIFLFLIIKFYKKGGRIKDLKYRNSICINLMNLSIYDENSNKFAFYRMYNIEPYTIADFNYIHNCIHTYIIHNTYKNKKELHFTKFLLDGQEFYEYFFPIKPYSGLSILIFTKSKILRKELCNLSRIFRANLDNKTKKGNNDIITPFSQETYNKLLDKLNSELNLCFSDKFFLFKDSTTIDFLKEIEKISSYQNLNHSGDFEDLLANIVIHSMKNNQIFIDFSD